MTRTVEVKLHAASSAVDTNFTGTLPDLFPDNRLVHIVEGIRRGSFRDSLEESDAYPAGPDLRVLNRPVGDQLRLQELETGRRGF